MRKIYYQSSVHHLLYLQHALTLFTVVLPFGTITFGSESGVSYDSQVSTLADDDPDYINYR